MDGGGRSSAGEVIDVTLPTFIVIGVAKAGTTSLYRYFDQHPDVFMYAEKGTNYFGYEDARDWKWADEGEPPLLRHFRVETFEEYEAAFAGSAGESAECHSTGRQPKRLANRSMNWLVRAISGNMISAWPPCRSVRATASK